MKYEMGYALKTLDCSPSMEVYVSIKDIKAYLCRDRIIRGALLF